MSNLTRKQKRARRIQKLRATKATQFQVDFMRGYNLAKAGATPMEAAKYVQFRVVEILEGKKPDPMEKLSDVECEVCGELFERQFSEDQKVCSRTCFEAAKLLTDDDLSPKTQTH